MQPVAVVVPFCLVCLVLEVGLDLGVGIDVGFGPVHSRAS